jgi:hypothetical protein
MSHPVITEDQIRGWLPLGMGPRSAEALDNFVWQVGVVTSLALAEQETFGGANDFTAMVRLKDALNAALRFSPTAKTRSKREERIRASRRSAAYERIIAALNALSGYQDDLLVKRARTRGIDFPTDQDLRDPEKQREAAEAIASLSRLTLRRRGHGPDIKGRALRVYDEDLFVRPPSARSDGKHSDVRRLVGRVAAFWNDTYVEGRGADAFAKASRDVPTPFMQFAAKLIAGIWPDRRIDMTNLISEMNRPAHLADQSRD